MPLEPSGWLETQLPGFEDSPLWIDLGLVISVPLDWRPGLTNVVTVRRIDHLNYLSRAMRTCVVDTNTGLAPQMLPAALEDQIEDYGKEVWKRLHPFI